MTKLGIDRVLEWISDGDVGGYTPNDFTEYNERQLIETYHGTYQMYYNELSNDGYDHYDSKEYAMIELIEHLHSTVILLVIYHNGNETYCIAPVKR